MKTKVVNLNNEEYDARIDRRTRWGNPFKITKKMTREDSIANYENWILRQHSLLMQLYVLKGKRLGCHCKPKACHGDVLAKLADKFIFCPECFQPYKTPQGSRVRECGKCKYKMPKEAK